MITIETSTDYELIADMLSRSPALIRPPSASKLRAMSKATFILARYNGVPSGVACIQKMDFWHSILKYLFVVEEYRRRGIAGELLSESVSHAEEVHRTPVVIATTSVENVPVHMLNRRHGFRMAGRFKSPLSESVLLVWLRSGSSLPSLEVETEEKQLEV
ncbi:MAG: GNAT family N-acetyltransferase [Anaerolineae bacterium]|nr:GNAT family N-acetyltransferase [Anaerolineae bacterium]